MKRFLPGILAAGLFVSSLGGLAIAAYVSLEGQGANRSGVVRSQSNDAPSSESAAEQVYKAEVMTLQGDAYVTTAEGKRVLLSEGDVLVTGDVVEVGEGAWVDVAFDKDWKNVTRFEAGSKFTIKSMEPAVVYVPRGSVYARLKQLPKDSSFKVETPTAVAAVRGSEYQVDVDADGKTNVSNLSESPVFVNGVDEKGVESAVQTILKNTQFTQILKPGTPPATPRLMTRSELEGANLRREKVIERIGKLKEQGRFGKIQDVGAINRAKEERRAGGPKEGREGVNQGPPPQREPLKKQAPRDSSNPGSLNGPAAEKPQPKKETARNAPPPKK